MIRALLLTAFLLSLPVSAQWQSAVQNSHIEANVPSSETFEPLLRRDLLAYFARDDSSVTSVEFKLLRNGPTQSGVAYPKYYLWVKAFAGSKSKEEGAIRVAAINRERFEVTDFLSKANVQSASSEVGSIFPAALVPSIVSLASEK
jgi:hypothetical protein